MSRSPVQFAFRTATVRERSLDANSSGKTGPAAFLPAATISRTVPRRGEKGVWPVFARSPLFAFAPYPPDVRPNLNLGRVAPASQESPR